MKLSTLLAVTLSLLLSATAQASTGTIVVKVENLRNHNQGQLTVALYQKMERVELDLTKAFKTQSVSVKGAELTVSFKDLPHGEYAIGILHDMDKNAEMNTNWIGIPREDLAISNNTKGGPFGGPKWADAKVTLKGDKLSITPLKMVHMYGG